MAAPRKSTAKRSSSDDGTPAKRTAKKTAAARRTSPASNGSSEPKKVSAMQVARRAAQQLSELTGRTPECVVGIERADDGWRVELEVVESRRIPDSTDILATYEVQTDEDGDLMGYHRVARYARGKGGTADGAGR
jgi:hypothetical protein